MKTVSGKEKMEGGNGTIKGIEIRKRSEKALLFETPCGTSTNQILTLTGLVDWS